MNLKGRSGTAGISSKKNYDSVEKAKNVITNTVKEKLGKGYLICNEMNSSLDEEKKKDSPILDDGLLGSEIDVEREALSSSAQPLNLTPSNSTNSSCYLECKNGSSSKFYELQRSCARVTTTYGTFTAT